MFTYLFFPLFVIGVYAYTQMIKKEIQLSFKLFGDSIEMVFDYSNINVNTETIKRRLNLDLYDHTIVDNLVNKNIYVTIHDVDSETQQFIIKEMVNNKLNAVQKYM
jgi:hypothetical protein